MKRLFKLIGLFFFVVLFNSYLKAQVDTRQNAKCYFGVGAGVDYGGIIGAKVEFLPIKHLGVFTGYGVYANSTNVSFGLSAKFTPDNDVCANIMACYSMGVDNEDINRMGLVLGFGGELKIDNRGNKITLGIHAPVNYKKFKDRISELQYQDLNNDALFAPAIVTIGVNLVLF